MLLHPSTLHNCKCAFFITTDWQICENSEKGTLMSSSDISLKYLANRYRLGKLIDQGAFGKIYKGTKINGGYEYAVKMESLKAQHPQLVSECKFYRLLHDGSFDYAKGIPRVYHCGTEDQYNFLVMELMGPSLQNLLYQTNKRFSLKTVLMLMDQMIERIEFVHSKHLLHRDIKPDNFCMGINQEKFKLYLIDFGLAKKYVLPNGMHIPYKDGKNLTGTARYASINTHKGIEQACRDDMESIGYVALYFLKGSLPWQGPKLNAKGKADRYQKIKEIKISTSTELLCKGCPEEFAKYLHAIKRLDFSEKPNYESLRQMFRELFKKRGYVSDNEYDWVKQTNVVTSQKSKQPK